VSLPSVGALLSTGLSDACVDYPVPYSPVRKRLFGSDSTAYVVYNSLKLDTNSSIYSFDYSILEVTGTYVKVRICKYGDTKIQRLSGTVIIVSASATGNKIKRYINQ